MTLKTVILGRNPLQPSTWERHDVESVCEFLTKSFPDGFPETGKIFHELVDLQHDVTPRPCREGDIASLDAAIEHLEGLEGVFYAIVYPAAAQAIQAAIYVGILFTAWVISLHHKKLGLYRPGLTGSPNNKLGDRQNTARVLGRIPYILGQVRSTPDLFALSYTTYIDHRETETSLLCVGVGEHLITDIREGDMLAGEIQGMSIGCYGPGDIPTGVDGTSIRQFQIGPFIDDPVFTARRVDAVNGQVTLPQNAFMMLGDIAVAPRWEKMTFTYISPGVGQIYVGTENVDKVRIGDPVQIFFPTDRVDSPSGLVGSNGFTSSSLLPLNITRNWIPYQDGTGPIPNLDSVTLGAFNAVTVTDIPTNPLYGGILFPLNSTITVGWLSPSVTETAWASIATYSAGLGDDIISPTNSVGNGGAIITVMNPDGEGREWVGPFFVDDILEAPNTRTVVCNFVAQSGLYADDGVTVKGFDVDMEVEVTAADSIGSPVGSPVSQTVTVIGAIFDRTTRAITVRLSFPEVQGRFLIRARRLTRTPWRQDAPHQYAMTVGTQGLGGNPIGGATQVIVPALARDLYGTYPLPGPRLANNGGSKTNNTDRQNSAYLPFHGTCQDEIRWTHCYTLTTVPNVSFGNLTLLHVRSVANEGAKNVTERKLNCFAYRRINTWNGATFGGPVVENNDAENCLFTALKDYYIGNLPDAQIDFPGIADAFEQVRAAFGGPTSDGIGGDEAGQFNYTFDDDKITLEETISTICQACFCIPYREGSVIKVKPDLASVLPTLLINHRNRIQGSEQRKLIFGTDQDFDGVRIDYVDTDINTPNDDAIKTYTIPPNDAATKPQVLTVHGIRLRKHAIWHAWRAYQHILYQRVSVDVQTTQEAATVILDDRILIADVTHPSTMDGEVLEISGSTIVTSQDVVITGGAQATIFLQHTDGSIESMLITANLFDKRQVFLAAPPALTLVTDQDKVRTKYWITLNDSNTSRAFVVQEKECIENKCYQIRAANYSHAYHWMDGMYFWFPFDALFGNSDAGPYEFTTAFVGGATTTTDVTRGQVYVGTTHSQHINITSSNVFASESYTKCVWANKANDGQPGSLLGSVETADETFLIDALQRLTAGHNNIVHVQVAFPAATWSHAAVSWDKDTLEMVLYIDGVRRDSAQLVPARSLNNLRPFGAFAGVNGLIARGDDLRYYARVLSEEEIREIYLKTRA